MSQKHPDTQGHMSRRRFMAATSGAVAIAVLPGSASASEEDVRTAIKETFGDRPVTAGRVTLKLPPIAENGYSVPLDVEVESPMSEADHVRQIAIYAPRNPLPEVAQFQLGARAGRAKVSTRIRMGGTQSIVAIAEMSDGSLWSGSAETVVTLAACVVL